MTASTRARYAWLLAFAVLLIPIQRVRVGGGPDVDTGRMLVTTDHPGMEAAAVERLITIPIEDALSSVSGLRSVRSMSAAGRSTIEMEFLERIDATAAYLEVRQWLDVVHPQLPHASHRPVVIRGSMESRPVFALAFPAEGWNEREIRRRFEQIDGVARVDLSGLPRPEIVITPDRSRGAQPFTNAAVEGFREAHLVASLHRPTSSPVVIDGRLRAPLTIEAIPLASGLHAGDHVRVRIGAAPRATRATVDNRPLAFVAVHRQGDVPLVSLSRRLRAEAGSIDDALVLTDRGDDVERAVHGVLRSIAAGIAAVGVVITIARRSARETLFCIASIAAAGVCGLSAVGISGIELTAESLAAIAVSAGFSADLALFVLDAGRAGSSRPRARTDIAPTIVCAVATTMVVCAPLLWWPEARGAGLTGIAVVICGSLAGAALFVLGAAPGIPEKTPSRSSHVHTPFRRACGHAFPDTPSRAAEWMLGLPGWAAKRRTPVIAVAVLLSFVGGLAAWHMHRFGVPRSPESSLSLVVEFPGGTTPDAVGTAVEPLRAALEGVAGIRTSVAVIEAERARFELFLESGRELGRVRTLVQSVSTDIPSATIWFPQDAAVDARRLVPILVRAGSTREAQDIARDIASRIGGHPSADAILFRFKEGAAACVLRADLDGLARINATVRDLVEPVRRVYSRPVIAKWHHEGQEIDVVLAIDEKPRGDCLPDVRWVSETVPPGTGDSLSASWEPATGRISRHDRAPSAELVVITNRPAEIRSVAVAEVQRIPLPAFATVHVDPSEPQRKLRLPVTAMASALALMALTLLIHYGQLRAVVTALSLVPPTLALPLVVAAVFRAPLDLTLMAGLLLAAGSGVNNAILVLDRVQQHSESGLEAIQHCLTPIALATITTVVAVLPLLALGAHAGTATMISMVGAVGAVGAVSALAATTVLLPVVVEIVPPLPASSRTTAIVQADG